MSLLQCPTCSVRLRCGSEQYACPKCGVSWPAKDGIPRFFQMPDHYWGEVDRQQAVDMITAARRGSWVQAVCERFPERDNMRFGLLDLQRASWAPMLGLTPESVVADIGSGYGCITQSLSRFAKEVYSVEAVTERIEFTQERLRQENVSNVHLVQASATSLPLADNEFDLVVVNGVLEWVGEWDLSLAARTVQINFLAKICRLLKENGLLLLGIENRFGLSLFRGGRDHSGLPYTSLVPRKVANLMLRYTTNSHYRTQLNAKREYRTLTYSKNGYRKILQESGFANVDFYWSNPGYNQPYSLVPLSQPEWVKEHFVTSLEHPGSAPRRSWRRRLKRMAAPFFAPFIADFVMIASKQAAPTTELERWIQHRLARSEGPNITWELQTGPFKEKSIVRLGDGQTGARLAYLKVYTPNGRGSEIFETERANRSKVEAALRLAPTTLIRVPKSYGTLQVGNTSYYLESALEGELVSTTVRRLSYFDKLATVARDFQQMCERIVELTIVLQQVLDVSPVDPSWLQIPVELQKRPELLRVIERNRYFEEGQGKTRLSWIQHGDLTVENTCLTKTEGEFGVFDWGSLAAGLPPLYDLIQFFLSVAYLPSGEESSRFASTEERWMSSFRAVFLSDTPFGQLARQLIRDFCGRLEVSPEQFPSLLLEFLIIRCSYYDAKSVQHRFHVQALEACAEQSDWLGEQWGAVPHLNSV